VWLVYVGVPLIFLGLVLWMCAGSDDGPAKWAVVVGPLAVLGVGLWRRGKSRFTPVRWPAAGFLISAVAALLSQVFASVLGYDWPSIWSLPVTVAAAIVGQGFGRYAVRALMNPAVPELADSEYELSFRMRGLTRLRLSIGDDRVALHEQMVLQGADGRQTTVREKAYPFGVITGVHAVTLSGSERLRYPVPMKLAPASSPGPALILQAQGEDWVLPQNEAAAIAEILERRMAR
jgi:hypothetical protein